MLINEILIHVKEDRIENPKATVIITHGIAEHSGRYDELALKLNEASYDVIRYDLRGHGKSQGDRGKLKSFHQFIDDLHALVLEERKKEAKKLILFGHSLGGLIVNLYAVKYHDVDGIVSSGAPTNYIKDVFPLRIIGFRWLSWVSKKTNFADDQLSRIKKVEEDYVNDPLVLKKFYVSLAGNMFIKGVKYLNKNIANYKTPVLFQHGSDDKIVPAAMSKRFYELINVSDKKLIIYQGNYHEIYNDLDKNLVISDLINWLDDRN